MSTSDRRKPSRRGTLLRGWACALGAIVLLAACSGERPLVVDGGEELLERVRSENYRQWRRAPGWTSRMPSVGDGHGGQLDIYVNDAVAAVLEGDSPVEQLPTGSRIVKDVWDGNTLHAIAIMDKRQDGWYWAEFEGTGEVLAAGHPPGCIDCHRQGADYVRAFPLQ